MAKRIRIALGSILKKKTRRYRHRRRFRDFFLIVAQEEEDDQDPPNLNDEDLSLSYQFNNIGYMMVNEPYCHSCNGMKDIFY